MDKTGKKNTHKKIKVPNSGRVTQLLVLVLKWDTQVKTV